MIHEILPVGPLQCNCSVFGDEQTREAIVIDPGDNIDGVLAILRKHQLKVKAIVITHAHIDHIGALGELRERTGGRGLLHPGDEPLYATLREQARWLGVAPPPIVTLDGELTDGDSLNAGGAKLDVLHTPGHTPGSVSFALDLGDRALLLTGDTLFREGVGRWDLGGTSLADIARSIRSKLFAYPDETVVIPGHGPATTIGHEKRENPYVGALGGA